MISSQLIIIAVLAILASDVNCKVPQPVIDAVMATVKKCDNIGLDYGYVMSLLEHRVLPKNRDEECVAACSLKIAGMLVNGKFNTDIMGIANSVRFGDQPESLPKLKDITKKCTGKGEAEGKDDCDKVGVLLRCSMETMKAENVKPANLH